MRSKSVAIILTVLLVVNAFSITSFAKPGNGNGKGNGNSAKFNTEFSDLHEASWANDAVSNMSKKGVISGYGNGIFKPNKSVTELEAIIMALRLTGLEDEANEAKEEILSGKKHWKFDFDEWAAGYIDIAISENIIGEGDVGNLNAAAKRYKIAKYIVRALGMEDEAQDHMDSELPFKDTKNIPAGYSGYVYVAYDLGLINGFPNGMYQPFKPATRAEMAVILTNIDEDLISDSTSDYSDYDTYTGVIETVDSDEIEIDTDDGDFTFDFDNKVEINFEDVEGDIEDLKVEDEVKVWVNEDDEIVRIDVDRDLYTTYTGIVEEVDSDEIEVDTDDGDKTFEFDNNVEVNFDEDEGKIEDILVGDEVKVWVNEDDEVVRVDVEGDLYTTYEGEIEHVDEDEIRIEMSGPDQTFDFDKDVEVEFDDEEGNVTDLKVGYEVTIKVNRDEEVIKVTLDFDLFEEVEGEVEEVDSDNIKLLDNSKEYDIDDDVKVEFNDENDANVSDVEVGHEVTLTVRSGDTVVIIDVDEDLN